MAKEGRGKDHLLSLAFKTACTGIGFFSFSVSRRSPWERLKMASEKHTKATRTKRQVDDTYKKRSASAAKLFLCFEFAELQPNSGGAMLAARSKGHQP